MKREELKTKLLVLIISILLTGLVLLLYVLDDSLHKGVEKIISCLFISLWVFFIIPSFRRWYIINIDAGFEEWFR